MARIRARLNKRRTDELTDPEMWELLLGPRGDNESAFPNDKARKAAWFAHREELMADCPEGTRPQAFWDFEAKEPFLEGETEHQYLDRLNLLAPEERESLVRWGKLPARKEVP